MPDHPDKRARTIARAALGPAVRRVRRELQWHTRGLEFRVGRDGTDAFPYVVAQHATPLLRPLSGLDRELQQNKIVNLRIAAERLDGIVLEQGVRLSFWREVGKPTRRRGFVDGMVLNHGRIEAGVGGGLCQMTNLLYWMTLHTPLSVVERWRHVYDVFPDVERRQPFGSGATCAWPLVDLQIENRTAVAYRLGVTVTDEQLVGSWRGKEPLDVRYRIEERRHRMTHDGPGLYRRHNQLWRLETDESGALLSEEMVAENSAFMMYAPFLPPAPGSRGL